MSEHDLLDMLPEHFSELKEIKRIANAQGKQFDSLYNSVDDLLNQVFIVTATWGLSYWERQYLLPVLSEDTDYEKRRRRILTKKRSNKANLVDILRASEPSLELGWGGLVLPFYIVSTADPYDFGELITTLEEEKPSHLSYSFNLSPYGYTVKANRNDRRSIVLQLISGTAKAGRWPRSDTRGESLHNILNVISDRVTGIAEPPRSAGVVSGSKEGVQTSFGSVGDISIQSRGLDITGVSTFSESGEIITGTRLTESVGKPSDITAAAGMNINSGYSSFPCGSRASGEEVA